MQPYRAHYVTYNAICIGLNIADAIIIIIIIFISSAALSKIRRAAGTCHSVLTKRCAFGRRAKVAVDSVDRRSSAGKLLQVSGPETAKFLRPMAVAVRCTSSFLQFHMIDRTTARGVEAYKQKHRSFHTIQSCSSA